MLKIISIEPGAASMSYDLRAAGLGYVATVWSGGKTPTDAQARQNAADIKAALDAIAAPAPKAKPVRKTAFTRDGYSFRPVIANGRPGFDIFPLNERSHWAQRGTIRQASDGATWQFHPNNGYGDARPDFDSIVALVLQVLGAKS